METKKIILITGAGASVPFGLPTGARLLQLIQYALGDEVKDRTNDDSFPKREVRLATRLKRAGERATLHFDDYQKEGLLNYLKASGCPSIDAFMAAPDNAKEFGHLGKLVLASVLLDQEQYAHLGTGDWLGEIIDNQLVEADDKLYERVEKFVQKVGIITFNYDRTIEHWLWQRMIYGQKRSPREAHEILKLLSVTHVYGHLGDYVPKESVPGESPTGVKFGESLKTKLAAQSIELIGERGQDQDQNRDIQFRQNLLSNAKRIAFLGFGYDETNLRILGFEKTSGTSSFKDVKDAPVKFSGGTAYGMTDLQCKRTCLGERNKNGQDSFIWGTESETCLEFVRRYEVIEHIGPPESRVPFNFVSVSGRRGPMS